ncbi:MAG: cysteine synthase family protein [Patescibacteria group bacterium]|nr:cysteine synthase family protein [Patescibacteria group bacterium]
MEKGKYNLLNAIGNTPLIELININKNKNVKIFCKFEGANPSGSIKDRSAYYMIKKAEKTGELTKHKTIVEPTSGNTGIAIAMICAVKGYKVKLVMPECVSSERRRTLEAFGAEVILTKGKHQIDVSIKKALQIVKKNPEKYYMPNQYKNENCVLAHYETTGPEIFSQTNKQVNVFTAGIGTGGTIIGVGRYLKKKNPKIKIIGIEPAKNHSIQGLKNMEESIVPKIYKREELDEKIIVEDEEAFKTARALARKEGLFVGISSGAAVSGALKIASKMKKGIIVTVLPDRGDRYLSTKLFRSYCAKCLP